MYCTSQKNATPGVRWDGGDLFLDSALKKWDNALYKETYFSFKTLMVK